MVCVCSLSECVNELPAAPVCTVFTMFTQTPLDYFDTKEKFTHDNPQDVLQPLCSDVWEDLWTFIVDKHLIWLCHQKVSVTLNDIIMDFTSVCSHLVSYDWVSVSTQLTEQEIFCSFSCVTTKRFRKNVKQLWNIWARIEFGLKLGSCVMVFSPVSPSGPAAACQKGETQRAPAPPSNSWAQRVVPSALAEASWWPAFSAATPAACWCPPDWGRSAGASGREQLGPQRCLQGDKEQRQTCLEGRHAERHELPHTSCYSSWGPIRRDKRGGGQIECN